MSKLFLRVTLVIFISTVTSLTTIFANGFELDLKGSWVGNGAKNGTITNTTNVPWFIKGYRANIPNTVSNITGYNPIGSLSKLDDGNAGADEQRWEIAYSGANNNNNFAAFGGSSGFSITPQGLAWDDKTTDWTPTKEQWLVKIGSFASKKSFIDIESLSIDSLKILVQQDFFYDSTIYVPDTLLGDRGGPASGGVINTWYDQEADSALWQVQMCATDIFKQNGEWGFFNPLVMGKKHASYGAGPMYAMALAMVTEYFHLDYQLMAASATNESMAAMESATGITDWNTGAGGVPGGGSLYITQNTELMMGPNHWEEATYRDVIWGGAPKYFPEDRTYANSGKYSTTPGTSDCVGNSPQIANSELINGVYYWYIYELLYNSTEFYADKVFREAADREISAKLFLAMWNGGRNSVDAFLGNLMNTHINNPDITGTDIGNDYIEKIYRAIDPMQQGSRDSKVIGGNKKVYDMEISLEHVEWFYFGEGGDPENGKLGDGGILHHFNIDEEGRKKIWNKLTEAYDILKAQGPFSGSGISLRYEWLALMRIVKGDLDLGFPTPTNSDFVTWVKAHSKTNVIDTSGGPVVENNYPHFRVKGRSVRNDSLIIKCEIVDETYLDIDSAATVQWSIDTNWGNWNDGYFVSGDTLKAEYELKFHKDKVIEIAGTGKASAWVRGYDRNFNATIDTFSIYWEMPPEPTFDSAAAYDSDGNGLADYIDIYLTGDKDNIDDYEKMLYSWPTKGSMEDPDNVAVLTDTLRLTDAKLTGGAGTGKVTFTYYGVDFNEEVDDRVGPAISKASIQFNDSRKRDTLLLVVSEKLNSISKTDHEYLLLDSESGALESEKSIAIDDVTYQFIFPKGAIENKDSVKFVYKSESVEDAVGNIPADNNQWIKITKQGGKEPQFKSAAIYDIDGDGLGDSVAVSLTLGSTTDKYTADSIESGKYSWPGDALDETLSKTDISAEDDETAGFLYNSQKGAGSGKLELTFPGDYTIDGTIADKVGPAITKATCLQQDAGRDNDSLILKVTESLKDNFKENTKYIILFEDSSNTQGDTISVEKILSSTDEYLFILTKDAVSYGDWVQFVYNSGIEDTVGNTPLNINQKVKINVLGGVAPNIDEALIFDVKGKDGRVDGNGDSIFVSLTLAEDPKALTVDSLKEVEYTWNGTTKTIDASKLTSTSSTEFSIVDDALTGGSGSGKVKLIFKSNGYEVSESIKDKVAPVVTKATYYNWSGQKDTLVVTFSESLDKTGSTTPFEIDGKNITVRAQNSNGTEITYSIEGGDDLSYGDSLWLAGSEDIVDEASNEQENSKNIKVEINYFRVTAVVEAAYYESDSRPDGHIDEIVIRFDAEVDKSGLSGLKDKLTLPKERAFTVNAVEKSDDQEITIDVTQNSETVKITSAEEYDSLSIGKLQLGDTLIVASGSLNIEDKLAPVLLSARMLPAAGDDKPLYDTLQVQFSEEIQKAEYDEPFRFSDASDGDNEYSLEFENEKGGKANVLFINEYNQKNILPGAGDSLWIYENGMIEDKEGNTQEKNTTPVPLTVGIYKRNYKVSISPTPFNLEHFEDSVVTIRIQPGVRLLPADIQAHFIMYDKVGNVIMEISKDVFGEVEDEMLKYSFKPANIAGRRLGFGSYPIRLYTTTNGIVEEHPLTLGISESPLKDDE